MPKSIVERTGFLLCCVFLIFSRIGGKGSKANKISMNLKVEISHPAG